jgi:hypothetical protein
MRELIQQLEKRTLFTATALTLVADLGTAKTDIVGVKTALLTSAATYGPDLKKLAADLKAAGGAGNVALARNLRHDAAKTFALLRSATGKVTGKLNSAASRSTAHGLAELRKATAHGLAKVQVDIAVLNLATTFSATLIANALGANTVAAHITAAGATNTSDATITADVNKLTADQATFTAYLNAATKLTSDVGVLATDLGTLS